MLEPFYIVGQIVGSGLGLAFAVWLIERNLRK